VDRAAGWRGLASRAIKLDAPVDVERSYTRLSTANTKTMVGPGHWFRTRIAVICASASAGRTTPSSKTGLENISPRPAREPEINRTLQGRGVARPCSITQQSRPSVRAARADASAGSASCRRSEVKIVSRIARSFHRIEISPSAHPAPESAHFLSSHPCQRDSACRSPPPQPDAVSRRPASYSHSAKLRMNSWISRRFPPPAIHPPPRWPSRRPIQIFSPDRRVEEVRPLLPLRRSSGARRSVDTRANHRPARAKSAHWSAFPESAPAD